MFRFQLFTVFSLLFVGIVFSQSRELGNVSLESLLEKQHPKDTAAGAAILLKNCYNFMTFRAGNGYTLNNVTSIKIKIYNKKGLKWANFKIPFYVGFKNISAETFKYKNAFTYNAEGSQIIKTTLKKEGVFLNKLNEKWNEAVITMPDVKVGSIIELQYTVATEYFNRLPDFDYQFDIPVDYMSYKSEIPEYYIYKTLIRGYLQPKVQIEVVSNSKAPSSKYCSDLNASPQYVMSQLILENIPALPEQDFVDNIENYRGSIHNELERLRMPGAEVKDYTETWEGVAKTIYGYDDFGKQLRLKNYFDDDWKNIMKPDFSDEQKIKTIFEFVQNRMSWDKNNRVFCEKGVKKAYKDQTGNSAEINFILISMLTESGLDASPVLVSTITNGTSKYPSINGFNYVIAHVKTATKTVLLDATQKNTVPGLLPKEILNDKGRLIKSDGTSDEISLMPFSHSKEITNVFANIVGLNIKGKAKIQFTDQNALEIERTIESTNSEIIAEYLERKYPLLLISSVVKSNKNVENEKMVDFVFDFEQSSAIEKISNKLYINPLLFASFVKNEFTQEQRLVPIHFGYPTQKKQIVNIEIPAEYEVESLPKSIVIKLEDNSVQYELKFAQFENTIQVASIKQINFATMPAENYLELKAFFSKIIDVSAEKIVLTKKL